MAPIEVGFRNSWAKDEEDFTVGRGKSKTISHKDKTLFVSCDRRDLGGRAVLTDESCRLETPDIGVGIEIPPPQKIRTSARIEIVDPKAPAGVIVNGELVSVIRHVPGSFTDFGRRLG